MIIVFEDDQDSLDSYLYTIRKSMEKNEVASEEALQFGKTFEEAEEILDGLPENQEHLFIVDMALPRGGWEDVLAGHRLIEKYKEKFPQGRWVAMTSRLDMRGTVLDSGYSVFEELFRMGIFGIWKKMEPQKLEALVDRFLAPKATLDEAFFRVEIKPGKTFVTQYESIANELISISSLQRGVLIFGEKGSGKGLAAEVLHKLSDRSKFGFRAIEGNSAELEVILFGREDSKPFWLREESVFHDTSGGTLFIRNMDKIPPPVQDKLWTYLFSIEKIDCRLIGGIEQKRNEFRDSGQVNRNFLDEFYAMELPNLRQRKDDIPVLLSLFVEQYSAEVGLRKELAQISEIVDLLQSVELRNNVKGLKSLVYETLLESEVPIISLEDFKRKLEDNERYLASVDAETQSLSRDNEPREAIGEKDIPVIEITQEDIRRIKQRSR